jgi:hypothetical protein
MIPTAVPDLAAKLADLHGLGAVLSIGWPGWKPRAYPNLHALNLGSSGVDRAAPSRADRVSGAIPWNRSVLVVDFGAVLVHTGLAAVGDLIAKVPVALLRAPDPLWTSVVDEAVRNETDVSFLGRVTLDDGTDGRLAIIDRVIGPAMRGEPPNDFRVLAILTTFNESDILESTIEALHRDGVEVHIVDNWSTDETFDIASRYSELGLVKLERFPAAPVATFNHADLLRRVETIASESSATWVLHHDTDERRRSPWPDLTMRRALWVVQQSGFNAVDHTVLTFRPVDNGWRPGSDPELGIVHFEVEARPDLLLQVRAWHSPGRVDLARSGGHEANFDGRRVFPYKFLLKHYPLRSQGQAERKVFRERRSRWNEEERAKGWHHHYDDLQVGQSFVWSSAALERFVEGRTQRELMVPFLGGAEVGQPWAVRARMTAIEGQFMGQQRAEVERRLDRWFGQALGPRVARRIRSLAWIVRPVRRALARRRWRRLATDQRSRQTRS